MKQQTTKKQRLLAIRINDDLYEFARRKCHAKFGIGLSSLIKIFLTSFVTQSGVGFYVGDDDLCDLFGKWLIHKKGDRGPRNGFRGYRTYLKDMYDLSNFNIAIS